MAKDKDDRTQAAPAPAPAPVAQAVADDGLVTVHKDGEKLRVHPTCLIAHLKAGWAQ